MASTQNSYASSYTRMKTTAYPLDDPRLVPTLAVPTPRFSLLPFTSTTYLRAPKSILLKPKNYFNDGNQKFYENETGHARTGCTLEEILQKSQGFGQTFRNGGGNAEKNWKSSYVLKGEVKDNSTDLINRGSSLLAKLANNGQAFVPLRENSSLPEAPTATINSSNSINTNINSDQTDSQIIKSKWNVSSPSALIPAISSGSKCLMGHKEVLTASLHTTVAHNQPLLTSDCYPPVTVEMEAPSVSHSNPLLYDSVNATACQYINYNKHMLEIKQQLTEKPGEQLNGTTPNQHHTNGQSEEKETDNLIDTDLSSTDQKVKENS